jgi:dienelactone hydrolase
MIKKLVLFTCTFGVTMFAMSQYQVGHMTKTFNDPSRTGGFGSGGGPGRQIQTEIYYPAATAGDNVAVSAGEHPVIVFGHGFAMSWDAYSNIWQHYASKGYILAFPRTEGGLIPGPSHNDFGLDLKIVGERMLAENSVDASLLFQKVKQAVVIMGHSMGGGATMIAGASNTGIKGIVGLAPAETNPSAITAAASITVPALVFSGSADGVTPAAEHHTPIYTALNSSCKSFVSIVGGAHCYFANTNFNCDFGESTSSTGISITRAEQQTRTYSILDPWLDFILNDNCAAYNSYLTALGASPSTLASQTTCTANPTPVINESAGVLTSSVSGTSYQWYLNGVAINGATAQNYTPVSNGAFTVGVFYAFGCDLSAPVTISGLSVDVLETERFTVYPNPSHGEVFIGTGNEGLLQIKIYDLAGKTVLKTETTHRIDLGSLERGTYLIQINGKQKQLIYLVN